MRKRLLIVGMSAVGVIALAVGGAALAQGSGTGTGGGDDRDEQITDARADRAGAAALRSLGSGRVVGVERDSDNAYEVEVERADGSTVDVDLNDSFQVVQDGDGGENDGAEPNDDRDDANEADDRDEGPNDRDDDSDDGPNDD